jgi:hypothetical protein
MHLKKINFYSEKLNKNSKILFFEILYLFFFIVHFIVFFYISHFSLLKMVSSNIEASSKQSFSKNNIFFWEFLFNFYKLQIHFYSSILNISYKHIKYLMFAIKKTKYLRFSEIQGLKMDFNCSITISFFNQ